jgi:hypothetical protein
MLKKEKKDGFMRIISHPPLIPNQGFSSAFIRTWLLI